MTELPRHIPPDEYARVMALRELEAKEARRRATTERRITNRFKKLRNSFSTKLSKAEVEVAILWVDGFQLTEISNQLHVQVKTIKYHLTNIYKKLEVRGCRGFYAWCLRKVL